MQATFDEAAGLWSFLTDQSEQLQSRFFACSTGPLNQLRWPDIAGLESFAGKRLHSSQWYHKYDMRGKQVGVIGTGSTASQLIPPVADQAGALHVFQRSANWVLPRGDRPYFALDGLLTRFKPYSTWIQRA